MLVTIAYISGFFIGIISVLTGYILMSVLLEK